MSERYFLKPGIRLRQEGESWVFQWGDDVVSVRREELVGVEIYLDTEDFLGLTGIFPESVKDRLLESGLLVRGEETLDLEARVHEASAWPPVVSGEGLAGEAEEHGGEIPLTEESLPSHSLSRLLGERRSPKRMQALGSLSAKELGTFLKWSAGTRPDSDRRTYPSAGALYPDRVFLWIHTVDGLAPGLYQYRPGNHSLLPCQGGGKVEPAFVQSNLDFNFCIAVVADFRVAHSGYGFRGYRFTLLEAGHLVQNMQLVARAMGWDALPVGGFRDGEATAAMGPEGKKYAPLYLVPVGKAEE